MRYSKLGLIIASTLIIASFFAVDRFRDPDQDSPLAECHVSDLERGPLASAASIARYSLAGIHLGMPFADVDAALKANADYVEVHPRDVPKDLADLRGKAGFKEVRRAIKLKQPPIVGNPDPDRGAVVTISVTRDQNGQDLVSRMSYQVFNTDQDEMDRAAAHLEGVLGRPTAQYNSSCRPFHVVAYSPSRKVESPQGLLTVQMCSAFGTETIKPISCSRKIAVDSTWAGIVSSATSYAMIIEDGKLTYQSRYPAWYQKSYFISELKEND